MNDQSTVDLLNAAITQAKKTTLYQRKLADVQSISAMEDFYRLPFTTKQDLRDSYPYGNLAVPRDQVVEVHTSSGTTGKPTLSFYTRQDLAVGNEYIAKAWQNFGITQHSAVQFIMGYGLFSGAALNSYAIQHAGALVIPAGIQPTQKQVELMQDFKVDTLVATPSYYLRLHTYLEQHGLKPSDLPLTTGIAAGEVYSDQLKRKIADLLQIRIFDHYGLCEVNTGIVYECATCGRMAVLKDYAFAEVVDPKTGDQLPVGEYGELVLSATMKQASPILRYKTGDSVALIEQSSTCQNCYGSTIISRIKGRLDDNIFYRGIKLSPHDIRDFIIIDSSKQWAVHGIKIEVATDADNVTEKITVKLALRSPRDASAYIEDLQRRLRLQTKAPIIVEAVAYDYFPDTATTKTKLVEYVNA